MRLENANIVNVETGEILRGFSMEIESGKIKLIEKFTIFSNSGLDCTGLYLLPGIISVHSHLSVTYPFSSTDESESSAISVLRALSRARDALLAGVTTVRSVHEINMADIHLRNASESGLVEVPRIFGRAVPSVQLVVTVKVRDVCTLMGMMNFSKLLSQR